MDEAGVTEGENRDDKCDNIGSDGKMDPRKRAQEVECSNGERGQKGERKRAEGT